MFRIFILLGLGGFLGYKLGVKRAFDYGKDYVVKKTTILSGSGIVTEEYLALDQAGQMAFVQDIEQATPFSPSMAENAISFIKDAVQVQYPVRFSIIEKPMAVTV
jgi:hypothetical protein